MADDDSDLPDVLRQAYAPTDVMAQYRAPVRRYADPSAEERAAFLPLVKPRGSSEYEYGVPGAAKGAWDLIQSLMSHGYRPGAQDEQGVRNATDVAGAAVMGMARGLPAQSALAAPMMRPMAAPTNMPLPWRVQADQLGARAAERAATTEKEVPAEAAYMFGDKLFTGPHHFAAQDKAYSTLGDAVADQLLASGRVREGFVTNKDRRFITRDEASRLLGDKLQGGPGYTSEEAWAKILRALGGSVV